MKKSIQNCVLVLLLVYLMSCDTNEIRKAPQDPTGNSITYSLESTSEWNINGTAVFREKNDGSTLVEIKLNNLVSTQEHPVHLHLGDVSVDKAEVAAWLNPVHGVNGESNTELVRLSDETKISYQDILNMEACIKIHLSAFGEGQDVVLAAGNIGTSVAKGLGSGRLGLGICKSN